MAKSDNIKNASYISVVIPVFNEEQSLRELFISLKKELVKTRKKYEVIFVDDGSTDGSVKILQNLKKSHTGIKIIILRRNFGKAAALNAGFKEVCGRIVFTMDADLQDDPQEIHKMLRELDSGYDLVSGWKINRLDPFTKTLPSKLFNFVTRLITHVKLHDFNCGFKAYRREVIENIDLYGEMHRFVPVIAFWKGFRVTEIAVKHHPRKHGVSKYGIERLLRGLFDFMTILFITKYTTKPMHFFGLLGLALFVPGLAICTHLTIQKITVGVLGHRPLLTLGILLIIIGGQFICTGLLGEMIVYLTRGKTSDSHIVGKII